MPHVDWDCSLDTWRDILPLCPDATFFHTPEWYLARAATTNIEVKPVHFAFDDGSRAVLPLSVRPRYRGLLQEALAGLENGYGGLLSPQPLRQGQVEAAYRHVRRRFPDLAVAGNPHATGHQVPEAAAQSMDITHVLPLRPPDEQLAGYSESRARHVRQAQRSGLRIEVLEGLDASSAARIYPLYAKHAAAWRYTKWARDEAYFRTLASRAGRHLTLFLAHHDDRVVGLHLVASYPPIAIQLHLATDGAFNRLNPASLLVHEALGWCYRNGFSAFDFMASGHLDGLKLFKASFGATPMAYPLATQAGWLSQSLHSVRQLTRQGKPRFAPAV
jgi:CelD/BcsL family acetyltransferase involved in cellulose biosynthesis